MENRYKKLTIKALESALGTLSTPSKMPCYSFSIPARRCISGMKLRKVKGSICSSCYALKGRYVFDNVQNALENRYQKLRHPDWVNLMVELINKKEKSGFFRWHDSGDLQDVAHLRKICEVANMLPNIKFWLPTREYSIVAKCIKKFGPLPENLTVRLSGMMFDGPAPVGVAARWGLTTSGTSTGKDFSCPSSKQGGKCLDCRACWDGAVSNIEYKKH